jgi:hypothetical protein
MIRKNKINQGSVESHLHQMRFFAQVAEKTGYSIAGVGSAYAIAGLSGLIAFGIMMLLFANLQSQIIYLWALPLNVNTLRISLLLRAFSFSTLTYGVINYSLSSMLIGAGLSGLFVGLFWPTFYTMKQQPIGGWFVFEKGSGVMLTVFAGMIALVWNILFILVASIIATIISFILTFRIDSNHRPINTSNSIRSHELERSKKLAYLDGFTGESIRMTRRLVIFGGSVVILGMEGIMSFALILGISEACGAIISKSGIFSFIHYIGVTLIGTLLCIHDTDSWHIGLILLGAGLSAMYPLLQEEMKSILANNDSADLNFRERYRFIGRGIGAIFAAGIYLSGIALNVIFFTAIVSLLALSFFTDLVKPLKSKNDSLGLIINPIS